MKGWTAKPLSTRRMAKRKRNHGVGGNLSQNSFLTGTKEMVAMGLCQTKKEMAREDSWVRRISLVGKHKRTNSGNGALLSISERDKAPPLPSSTKLLSQRQEPNLLQIHLTPCPLSRSRAVSYPYDHQLPRPLISSKIRDTVQCMTLLRCSALQILLPA